MAHNLNVLNKENFELYAAKAYKNFQCVNYEEFKSDLMTIKMIKKALSTRNRNLRLLVNQLILFFNVFETQAAVEMILYRTPPQQQGEVKTLMYFLNFIDDTQVPPEKLDLVLLRQLEEM